MSYMKQEIAEDRDNDIQQSPYYPLLEDFLNLPITDTEELFARFSALPGAMEGRGEADFEHYVYIPGTRRDRILLVAHADTVWDRRYRHSVATESKPLFTKLAFHSSNRAHGIGADDRAGCAMLWALRDSGHSLLLLDGEEHGKIGACYLRDKSPRLFREINRTHRMFIELDAPGVNSCLFNQVDNTDAFMSYIETNLSVCHEDNGSGCDLQILCRRVCGVNLGVGYLFHHSPMEVLLLQDWIDTYRKLCVFLEREHPRFPISKARRLKGRIRQGVRLPLILVRKLRRSGLRNTVSAIGRRLGLKK